MEKDSSASSRDRHPNDEKDRALIKASEAAQMCGISISMFYRLNQTKRTPKPIRFGKLLRWKRTEIQEWIDAGCPKR